MQDQNNDQIDGEEVPIVPAEAQEIKKKPEQDDGKEEESQGSSKNEKDQETVEGEA